MGERCFLGGKEKLSPGKGRSTIKAEAEMAQEPVWRADGEGGQGWAAGERHLPFIPSMARALHSDRQKHCPPGTYVLVEGDRQTCKIHTGYVRL